MSIVDLLPALDSISLDPSTDASQLGAAIAQIIDASALLEIARIPDKILPIPRNDVAVEVIDFLDEYVQLCLQKRVIPALSLQKSLQAAIDGGPIPKIINLKGSIIPELKHLRINDSIVEAIIKPLSNSAFTHDLDLSYNEIGNKGAILIADYLKGNSTLRTLNLKSNNIGSLGSVAIARALHLNGTVEKLNISYNKIMEQGGIELASTLQINTQLKHLNVAGCDLSAGSLIAFATVLIQNESIQTIDFSDNRFSILSQTVQCDVVKHVASTIQQNKYLKEISIAKLGITDWAVVHLLSPAIYLNASLQCLDLSCNKMSRDGGAALFKALHHQSLQTLKLSCCNIMDEGAEAAGIMLSKNSVIQRLYLDHNGISGVGLGEIAKGVAGNMSLNTLALWGNHWNAYACEAFVGLIGGAVSELSMGVRNDILPVILRTENLNDLEECEHEGILRIDARSIQSSNGTQNLNATEIEGKLHNRFAKNEVDFVIYTVEGIYNVAHQSFTVVYEK